MTNVRFTSYGSGDANTEELKCCEMRGKGGVGVVYGRTSERKGERSDVFLKEESCNN
jgi:hypothetical protein